MDIATQVRNGSFGYHLDIVDSIIDSNNALEHRATQGDIAFAGNGIRRDIDFGDDFTQSLGDDTPQCDAGTKVQIGGRDLGGQIVAKHANTVGLRAQFEHRAIHAEQRRLG